MIIAAALAAAMIATDPGDIDLHERLSEVQIERDADGGLWVVRDGRRATAGDYIAELARAQERGRSGGWHYALLNVSTPAGILWVVLGFLGQALFAGRMLLQWLVSEKRGRSTVPVGFWWLSLGGASMLMIYFIWRRDVVGVIGQTTGWLIYVRNLIMIYRGARGDPA